MSIFNKKNTQQNNIGFFKKYSKYIFITFIKEFFIWITAFMIVLFSINYIDAPSSFNFTQKMIYNIDKTLNRTIHSLNIILLITCISYFIKTKSSFNFHILQSFGITTINILKPILLFIIIFGIINIFCLKPISIHFDNARKFIKKQNLLQKNIKLKKNTKFTITDGVDSKDYLIVSGNFVSNNNTTAHINNVIFLEYKNKKLVKIYSAKNAFLQDKIWQLRNITLSNDNNVKKIKNFNLTSQFNTKELVRNIENNSKIEKSILLDLYDFLKIQKNKHKSKTENEAIVQSRLYFYEEITNFINSLLCCFIAFLFCFSTSRNIKIIKTTLKCFIIYFIFLRLIHSLEGIVKISPQATILIYLIDILICIFVHSLIIEKEKNSKKYIDIGFIIGLIKKGLLKCKKKIKKT